MNGIGEFGKDNNIQEIVVSNSNGSLNSSYEDIQVNNNDFNPILDNDKIDFKVGFIMVSLTIALLFPYQSFLSSLDYFEVIYPNYHPSSTILFVYMFLMAVAFIVVLKYSNKIRHHYNILSGFLVYVIVMIIIPLINLTSIGGTFSSYIVTLVLIGISSFFDGLINSSIYALAGLFSPKYSILCQIGTGISGVVVVLIRIIIKLSYKDSSEANKAGIIIFYTIGGVSVIIASLLFLYLLRSPLGKVIMKDNRKDINHGTIEINKLNNSQDSINDDQVDQVKSPVKHVFSITYKYLVPTFFLYFITLFLFPSIIMKIPVKGIEETWYIVMVVAIFNLFDFIGKMIPIFIKMKIYNIVVIWFISFSRVIFIFLIFMSIYINSFRVDSLVYIYIVIFGFSNGFISSILFANVSQTVQRKYKELSGILISFTVIIGLLIGAGLNLLVSLLVF